MTHAELLEDARGFADHLDKEGMDQDAEFVRSIADALAASDERIAALEDKMQTVARICAPGSRTLDELCRDMGYACDIAHSQVSRSCRFHCGC